MAVSNELAKPETEGEFEAMCHQLYGRMWRDSTCVRVGRSGQAQFGIDILGHDGSHSVGVQCKHFNKTPFTLSVVLHEVDAADKAGLSIGLLIFATTAASDSTVVKQVSDLNQSRRQRGEFAVSVHFWGDICGHIRMHPEVGRVFIPGFPGGTILAIEETTAKTLEVVQDFATSNQQFQASAGEQLLEIKTLLRAQTIATRAPDADGHETDPGVVASLDFIRDRLNEGRSQDALKLLEQLGDPERFRDEFSRFRWQTNRAAVDLMEGRYESAAERFLAAFKLAPDNEKASANRVHAQLLLKQFDAARKACDEGLAKFPGSIILHALMLHALHQLGQPDPESALPAAIRDADELLFARARLRSRSGDYEGAVELSRRCIAAKPDSIEAERAFLADALSWATEEPVAALHGQIAPRQREALVEAVALFEPIERTLASIQTDLLSAELTNNIAIALHLLGHDSRSFTVAEQALARHPLSEGLLRIRLRQLDDQNDVAAIRALTDSQLQQLPPAVVAQLAEISANRGQVAWHAHVMAVAETVIAEPDKLRQLHVLKSHAQWCSGDRAAAIEAAWSHVREQPSHVLGRIVLGHMLRRTGDHPGATAQANASLAALPAAGATLEVLQVAELFYTLKQFREAALLFSRVVTSPGRDELTYKLLVSLVSGDQRQRAQQLLDLMPAEARRAAEIRRLEVELARRTGDWPRMRDLLTLEVAERPTDAALAVGYAGALLRSGNNEQLRQILEADPQFTGADVDDEVEFAKYQAHAGLADRAIHRLFTVFRRHPSSAKVAGFFLMQMMMSATRPLVEPPLTAGPGGAVYLRSATDSWWVAIDTEHVVGDSWPEIVSPQSEVARSLAGHRVGDLVQVRRGMGTQEAHVAGLGTLLGFAAEKAHALIASAANPHGPIWSVRLIGDDGKVDIDTLLRAGKERRERVEVALSMYRQHPFPLCALAHMLGTEVETLLLDWPSQDTNLFVGFGTDEELQASRGALRVAGTRYVLDHLTLVELVRHGALEAVVRLLGKPLLPQTIYEAAVNSLHLAETSITRPSAVVGEQDGRLTHTPVPASYHDARARLLRKVLAAIDTHCDLTPVMGPVVVGEEHTRLAKVLDHATHDAVYLCLERNAVLLSEDSALRLLVASVGVRSALGTQAVLVEACDRGFLARDSYADIVSRKLSAGHDFVSVRAEDLMSLAERTPLKVAPSVRAALETFRRSTLDIASGAVVGSAFLKEAALKLSPKVVAAYARLVHEVLTLSRPDLAHAITRGLARLLQAPALYGRGGRRIAKPHRALFGPLLRRATCEETSALPNASSTTPTQQE
jgi:tetratricopeptide (TPR) repeat protein